LLQTLSPAWAAQALSLSSNLQRQCSVCGYLPDSAAGPPRAVRVCACCVGSGECGPPGASQP
jgi:hypothetical protein